ncbi:hypothetical protein [Agrococcus sp. SCSIO52902]|uniref:hypothetical protein n=1 Tax=Agrococcus sp. SCSIO52902 TaxID=2933290 RepID=UPI001FF306EE|nr:hypothetical protein [Agrococcus sp. SCSIO52902]UOW00003.1 hypothetical protein MU522_08580 [Agrococcus sp. SCSIO52902]
MSDEDLRRRLQEIPAPRARLDAAAAIDGAKRRRRPKVAALTAAATGAGVLIVAPLVAPGLTPLSPSSDSSVLSEGDDGGAAPEAAQPSAETEGAPGDSGAGAEESAPIELCGLTRAGDVGLALRLLEDPADASIVPPGRVEARGAGLTSAVATFVDVDALVVDGGVARATAGTTEQDARLAGGAGVLGVTTGVLAADACGPGTPSGPSPVALVALDGSAPVAVVGEPWEDVR